MPIFPNFGSSSGAIRCEFGASFAAIGKGQQIAYESKLFLVTQHSDNGRKSNGQSEAQISLERFPLKKRLKRVAALRQLDSIVKLLHR